MTEPSASPDLPTPPAPPAAFAPAPDAAAAPAAPAKKSHKGRNALLTIVIILVVLVGGGALAAKFLGSSQDFKVGACIDQISTSDTAQQTTVPNVVDCSNSGAKAKIVAVLDGKHFSDAETLCPSDAVAAIELTKSGGDSQLLCLVAV